MLRAPLRRSSCSQLLTCTATASSMEVSPNLHWKTCMRQKLTQADIDLHLGNILLTAPRGFELLCDEELREGWGGDRRASKLKPTTTSHFWTPSAFPSFATLPAFFGENSEEISLSDAAILLTEFGTFFCPSQETRFTFPTAPHCRPPRINLSQNDPVRSLVRSGPLPVQYGAVIGQRSLFETYFCSMIGQQLNRSRRWDNCRPNGGRGGKHAPNTSQKTASSSETGASLRWMRNLIAPYRTGARSWGKKWFAWMRRGHS